jgi:hypothetical protein
MIFCYGGRRCGKGGDREEERKKERRGIGSGRR